MGGGGPSLARKGIDGRAVTYGADPWRLLPLTSAE